MDRPPDLAMQASSHRVRIFINAIFGLCLLVVCLVLGVTWLRPETDNLPLIGTVVSIFAPIVAGLLAAALKENHDAMNSRLTQLLGVVADSERAKGKLDATAHERN